MEFFIYWNDYFGDSWLVFWLVIYYILSGLICMLIKIRYVSELRNGLLNCYEDDINEILLCFGFGFIAVWLMVYESIPFRFKKSFFKFLFKPIK